MTDEYWLTCTSPDPMLEYLREKTSDRKLMLFSSYCCRSIYHLLNEVGQRLVENYQRMAAGLTKDARVSEQDLRELTYFVHAQERSSPQAIVGSTVHQMIIGAPWAAAWNIVGDVRRALRETSATRVYEELPRQVRLAREIFPNPFRPSIIDPSCLTEQVMLFAKWIYDCGDFEGLPALSDALEEAGCNDTELLTHLRNPGPHLRGCWALDKILRKD